MKDIKASSLWQRKSQRDTGVNLRGDPEMMFDKIPVSRLANEAHVVHTWLSLCSPLHYSKLPEGELGTSAPSAVQVRSVGGHRCSAAPAWEDTQARVHPGTLAGIRTSVCLRLCERLHTECPSIPSVAVVAVQPARPDALDWDRPARWGLSVMSNGCLSFHFCFAFGVWFGPGGSQRKCIFTHTHTHSLSHFGSMEEHF